MKKVFTLTAVCTIICLVFASCKSNLSITKRHYNNGYYIAHSKGKQAATSSKEDVKIVQHKASVSPYSVLTPIEKKTIHPSEQNSNTIVAASTSKTENKIVSKSNKKQVVNAKTGIVLYPVAQIKSKSSGNSSIIKSDDDR